MSGLTQVLFTIGLVLLSVGLTMRWQERRHADDDSMRMTED